MSLRILDDSCCLCVMMQNEIMNIDAIKNNISKVSRYAIVDGGSDDGSDSVLEESGIAIMRNRFAGFAAQRMYLKQEVKKKYDSSYILFLDADEVLSDENIIEINDAINKHQSGMKFKFDYYYCGKKLNYAYRHPVVQRLYKVDQIKGYDQGAREYYERDENALMAKYPIRHEDKKQGGLTEINKIYLNAKRESDWERNASNISILRKVWLKLPLVTRSIIYFLYLYFIKLGFKDGQAGFKYLLLNVLIYRLLIDYELAD